MAMSNLDSLVQAKKSVIFGKTPPSFLQQLIQAQAVSDTAVARALRHARAFVEALENTRGAPRGNVWAKREHREPRVYFAGTLGFVRVSPQGVISGDNSREARLTLYMPGLYPSQRSAYRKAKELYEAGAGQREAENVAALQERMAEINEELDRHPRIRPFLEADDEAEADEEGADEGADEGDEDFDDEDFDDEDDEDEVVTLDELRERVRMRDEENEAIERAAERAAWQERHEAGRRNPSPPLRRVSPGRYVTQDGMWEISRVTEGVDEGWWRWESSLASDQITEHLSIEHVDADPVPTKADATYELFYCLAHAEEYPSIARRLANLAKVRPHKNPSPLPEGFITRFGGGVSDDYVAPPLPASRRVLRDVQRGDVVTVGRTKWAIIRSLGDAQVSAYKYPSKRTKRYEIQAGAHGEDYVVVFEVGGSGQRISEDVATGPLRETNEKVEMF